MPWHFFQWIIPSNEDINKGIFSLDIISISVIVSIKLLIIILIVTPGHHIYSPCHRFWYLEMIIFLFFPYIPFTNSSSCTAFSCHPSVFRQHSPNHPLLATPTPLNATIMYTKGIEDVLQNRICRGLDYL